MNSVDNVARVLRLFTPERSVLSVTEVSQLLALPKSSIVAAAEGDGRDRPAREHRAGRRLCRRQSDLRDIASSSRQLDAQRDRRRGAGADRQGDRPHRLRRDARRHRRARPADAAGQQAVAGRDVARRPAAGVLLLDRPRAAGAPRRRCGPRALSGAAAAAVAQRTADDRRSARRARGGAREGLVAGDRREPAGRRIDRRLRRGPRERRADRASASPIPPP